MTERPAGPGTRISTRIDADELPAESVQGEPTNSGSTDLWIEDADPAVAESTGMAPTGMASTGTAPTGSASNDQLRDARLVSDEQRQALHARWSEIQAMFVDEPRQAVNQADSLVSEVVDAVTSGFATRKAGLEQRWGGGGEVATEDLRQALQAYRAFFQRLLQI
jgi:hypothetical protein